MLRALERIEKEAPAQADTSLGAIDREAGDQANRDWKALGRSALHRTGRTTLLDL